VGSIAAVFFLIDGLLPSIMTRFAKFDAFRDLSANSFVLIPSLCVLLLYYISMYCGAASPTFRVSMEDQDQLVCPERSSCISSVKQVGRSVTLTHTILLYLISTENYLSCPSTGNREVEVAGDYSCYNCFSCFSLVLTTRIINT